MGWVQLVFSPTPTVLNTVLQVRYLGSFCLSDPAKVIEFIPSGRGKAQCKPDPRYPNGIALDSTLGVGGPHCVIALPYPAPECGLWDIQCDLCDFRIMVTAAGRPDDPISVKVACFAKGKEETAYA